ncbi:MAG TPA: hypothetical protein VGE74_22525 [Gemmata sp.]
MSEKVRLVWGTCPKHGRVLSQVALADRARCPRCDRSYGRDTREPLDHITPYCASDWEAARTVAELRTCDAAFGREWSPRRHRLAFCALARLYFAHARQYWLWNAVEAGEVWADRDEPPPEAADIFQRLNGPSFDRQYIGPSKPGEWTWLAVACVWGEEEVANEFDWGPPTHRYPPPTFDLTSGGESHLAPAPALVFRELSTNPFVPLTWKPDWFTSTVCDIAAHIYEAREFGAMPILADALQDAGCDAEPVLAHCRMNRPHARGCWVLDAILGKS